MPAVKYDTHYREDAAACGEPFPEFTRFCQAATPGSVLDLGCGQGRDALPFARAGHRVVGVDVSAVGVGQMLAVARNEELEVEGVVADIVSYSTEETFDVVILDRVLHMLQEPYRMAVLHAAMAAVAAGGHLLVAEGPKGMVPVRRAVEGQGWRMVKASKNRLIARRPGP